MVDDTWPQALYQLLHMVVNPHTVGLPRLSRTVADEDDSRTRLPQGIDKAFKTECGHQRSKKAPGAKGDQVSLGDGPHDCRGGGSRWVEEELLDGWLVEPAHLQLALNRTAISQHCTVLRPLIRNREHLSLAVEHLAHRGYGIGKVTTKLGERRDKQVAKGHSVESRNSWCNEAMLDQSSQETIRLSGH